ncbi:bifunctional P-loop containing nucleoside triphosphate hydrolase/Sec1-like superfamily/ATPase [Babesia duncani]|uniref:Bifunctional P-loop containing nucleoside triphosphate hydrolase/Sec1-like superfamily/ATPase n=1 Tax=Babesia duncani TaxID=323732 RepID=A0AAD9UNP8_9APIC|nr:bifunctional P-loop containing nucleoside triphosphate hydrolase/Sec1-like superfamily/ATPase [Babesia duncani]
MDIRSFFGGLKPEYKPVKAPEEDKPVDSKLQTPIDQIEPKRKRRLKRHLFSDSDDSDSLTPIGPETGSVRGFIKDELGALGSEMGIDFEKKQCDASNLQTDINCWTSTKKELVDPFTHLEKSSSKRKSVDLDSYLDLLSTPEKAKNTMDASHATCTRAETKSRTKHNSPGCLAETLNKRESPQKKFVLSSTSSSPTIMQLFSQDSSGLSSAEASPEKRNGIEGLRFVFTGILKSLDRDTASANVRRMGGIVVSAVSGKTDYLVVGEILENGKHYTTGNKYKKATELNKTKGVGIVILNEDQFLSMCSMSCQAPVEAVATASTAPTISAEAKAPEASTGLVPSEHGLLLSERYRPRQLSDLCGNSASVAKLLSWLESWESVHVHGIKRDAQRHGNSDEAVNAPCALLSGQPGVGKTTCAKLVAAQCQYDCIEFNASDMRNKAAVERIAMLATGGTTLNVNGAQHANATNRCCLLLDEVDGMSGGDRGGLQAIAALIPKLKCPMICICNDRQNQKLTTLASKCLDIRFTPPTRDQFVRSIRRVIESEGFMQISGALIDNLYDECGGDLRHALNAIEFLCKSNDVSGGFKDSMPSRNLFETCRKIFKASDAYTNSQIQNLEQVYFLDYNIVPLFVQENYLKFCSIRLVDKLADTFALADNMDECLRRSQAFTLLVDLSILMIVYPVMKIRLERYMAGDRIYFPQILGRTSTRSKNRRLLGDIDKCLGGKSQVKGYNLVLDGYLDLVHDKIMGLINTDIEAAVTEISNFGLTRDLVVDGIASSLRLKSLDNVYQKIPTAKKSQLTRRMHALATRIFTGKRGRAGMDGESRNIQDDDFINDESSHHSESDEDQLLKVIPAKKPRAPTKRAKNTCEPKKQHFIINKLGFKLLLQSSEVKMSEENPFIFPGLVELMRLSFTSIFDRVRGAKILVLDSSSSRAISLVCTHSWLLEREVLLTVSLNDDLVNVGGDENLRHLRAVYLISGNLDSVQRACTHIRRGDALEYFVFFTSRVENSMLESLARADVFELVHGVYEYMVDVSVLNDWLFDLHAGDCRSLYSHGAYNCDDSISRVVQGLYCALCLCRQVPSIVYASDSASCRAVAMRLQSVLNNESIHTRPILESYNEYERIHGIRGSCCCIIIDRTSDMVTPLLNQWSYEAMLHEIVGLECNKANIEGTEYIFSRLHDDFYAEHAMSEFADVESALTELLKQSQQSCNSTNLLQLLEQVPKSNKLMSSAAKHVTALNTLSTAIQNEKLLDIGLLEQEMACGAISGKDALDQLGEFINDGTIPKFQKLRLALIYTLVYGSREERVNMLRDHLRLAKLEEYLPILNYLVPKARPQTDTNIIARAKNTINRSMMGVAGSTSPYMQHRSSLYTTLQMLLRGKLIGDYAAVPSVEGDEPTIPRNVSSILVFIVGGATFAEARDCRDLSLERGVPIRILGHQSKMPPPKKALDAFEVTHLERPRVSQLDEYQQILTGDQRREIKRPQLLKFTGGKRPLISAHLKGNLVATCLGVWCVFAFYATFRIMRPEGYEWVDEQRQRIQAAKAKLEKIEALEAKRAAD